jgi:uncharacterized RDD family membrane protein YckC
MKRPDMEYVGFWPRVGATVIDAIIIWVITLPVLTMIYGATYWHDNQLIHGPAEIIVSWIFPVVATVWLWVATGQTPGKMAIGARVVDAETGDRITMVQAVVSLPLLLPKHDWTVCWVYLGWVRPEEAGVARPRRGYRGYSKARSSP